MTPIAKNNKENLYNDFIEQILSMLYSQLFKLKYVQLRINL